MKERLEVPAGVEIEDAAVQAADYEEASWRVSVSLFQKVIS